MLLSGLVFGGLRVVYICVIGFGGFAVRFVVCRDCFGERLRVACFKCSLF